LRPAVLAVALERGAGFRLGNGTASAYRCLGSSSCPPSWLKIASDLAKPNGQREVPGDVAAFLAPLPVSRLWGVGPKTEEVLLRLGLKTIGAVVACDPGWLLQRLGDAGEHLYELSRGRDDRPVVPGFGLRTPGSRSSNS
jgi:DNA polymerase-4